MTLKSADSNTDLIKIIFLGRLTQKTEKNFKRYGIKHLTKTNLGIVQWI